MSFGLYKYVLWTINIDINIFRIVFIIIIIMNTFIEKNILLDEIVQMNEYITSYPDTRDSIYFVELLMELRNSTNTADDLNTFEILLDTINNIIHDINEYIGIYDNQIDSLSHIQIIETTNIDDIQFLHQVIYGLNNTIIKINIYINSLNSVDSITDIFESIKL